jgi:hypothetical protein
VIEGSNKNYCSTSIVSTITYICQSTQGGVSEEVIRH